MATAFVSLDNQIPVNCDDMTEQEVKDYAIKWLLEQLQKSPHDLIWYIEVED